jgi:hypothetical protein
LINKFTVRLIISSAAHNLNLKTKNEITSYKASDSIYWGQWSRLYRWNYRSIGGDDWNPSLKDEELDVIGELISNMYGALEVT